MLKYFKLLGLSFLNILLGEFFVVLYLFITLFVLLYELTFELLALLLLIKCVVGACRIFFEFLVNNDFLRLLTYVLLEWFIFEFPLLLFNSFFLHELFVVFFCEFILLLFFI